MQPTILVTGATGNIGSQIVKQLVARGVAVRALVHSAEKAAMLPSTGVDIILGDYEQPATLATAVEGIDRAFVIVNAPGRHLDYQGAFLAAAQRAGVGYIVNLSMLGAESDSAIAFARAHWEMDRQLAGSGIAFTHLRPNLFMQNHLRQAATIAAQGMFYLPLGDARVSLIDIRDIAAVAVGLLLNGGYAGAELVITGGEALNNAEVARKIGEAIGKRVEYVAITLAAAREAMLDIGMPGAYVDDLIELYRLFGSGYGESVTDGVNRVGNKTPIPFSQFARDHAAIFSGQ